MQILRTCMLDDILVPRYKQKANLQSKRNGCQKLQFDQKKKKNKSDSKTNSGDDPGMVHRRMSAIYWPIRRHN